MKKMTESHMVRAANRHAITCHMDDSLRTCWKRKIIYAHITRVLLLLLLASGVRDLPG